MTPREKFVVGGRHASVLVREERRGRCPDGRCCRRWCCCARWCSRYIGRKEDWEFYDVSFEVGQWEFVECSAGKKE